MKKYLLNILILSIFISSYNPAYCQDTTSVMKDLKVGVVLSGGGAKGVAHVGVLRMIEEAGIKVDYIGGASMGAIVAALYSVGYTVDELDSIIKVLDMSKLVQGDVPRRHLTYFEKAFDGDTFISVPVKNWEIGLPQGLSNGQSVIDEFFTLTRAYPGHQDFNKLPVPLIMTTTDIVTGESVVFHEGSIPLVMRASSSFPSLFSPIDIDGKLLVDGGVMNNFPVKEVLEMGADVIIGVSVEDGLYKRKDLTSITSIIEQITSFKMVEKSEEQKKLVDIYIKPNITGYSVVSFDKTNEIIELGEVEAFKHFNEFVKISEAQNEQDYVRKAIENVDVYDVSEVEIKGAKNYSDRYFIDRFPLKNFPGKITIDEIRFGLKTIEGTRNFDFISYELIKIADTDKYKMILKISEKPTNERLKLGIHFDNLYGAGLKVKYAAKNKILKSSMFLADIVVSNKPRYSVLFYKDNASWPGFFVESRFDQFEVDVPASTIGDKADLISGSVLELKYKDWTNRIMAQKTIDENFYFALGLEMKRLFFTTNSVRVDNEDGTKNDDEYVFDDSWSLNPMLEVYADTRDDGNYPTKGLMFKTELKAVVPQSHSDDTGKQSLITNGYFYFRIDYSLPLNDKFAWTNRVNSSTKIGTGGSEAYNYFFGGYNKTLNNNIYSFYGYPLFGISDTDNRGFIKYTTSLQYELITDIYITAHANYMIASKDKKEWYQIYVPQYSGYALSAGYDSRIGPVEFTLDYSPETGRVGLLFNLGYWF